MFIKKISVTVVVSGSLLFFGTSCRSHMAETKGPAAGSVYFTEHRVRFPGPPKGRILLCSRDSLDLRCKQVNVKKDQFPEE